MEFIVKDFKERMYKVVCNYDEGMGSGAECEVYRAVGIGGNEYDYGEMEYEEEPSSEFSIYKNECDYEDDEVLESYLERLFKDELLFHRDIYSAESLDDDERYYDIVVFKADDKNLLLSMIVPIDDVEEGDFEYTQEVAIDCVVCDAVAIGHKFESGLCTFKKVELYQFDKSDKIRDCSIIKVASLNNN